MMFSAVAVGFCIGWFLDNWLETGPWLKLVFLLLGAIAGVLNVYRITKGFGYSAGYNTNIKQNKKINEIEKD